MSSVLLRDADRLAAAAARGIELGPVATKAGSVRTTYHRSDAPVRTTRVATYYKVRTRRFTTGGRIVVIVDLV